MGRCSVSRHPLLAVGEIEPSGRIASIDVAASRQGYCTPAQVWGATTPSGAGATRYLHGLEPRLPWASLGAELAPPRSPRTRLETPSTPALRAPPLCAVQSVHRRITRATYATYGVGNRVCH